MLMGKDLLVPRTEIAQLFVVGALYMPMKIWPAPTSNITIGGGTIVTKQQNCVVMNFFILVLDSQYLVSLLEVSVHKVLIALISIVGKYHELGFRLNLVSISSLMGRQRTAYSAMCTSSCLVQSPQAQRTNVARPVIARCNRIVNNGRSTYEADFSFYIPFMPLIRLPSHHPHLALF